GSAIVAEAAGIIPATAFISSTGAEAAVHAAVVSAIKATGSAAVKAAVEPPIVSTSESAIIGTGVGEVATPWGARAPVAQSPVVNTGAMRPVASVIEEEAAAEPAEAPSC